MSMNESGESEQETRAPAEDGADGGSFRESKAGQAPRPEVRANIWFDVRCPWCFLAKRRFERAVSMFTATHPEIPVTVSHHSFELAPGMPDRFAGGEAEYLLRYEGVPLEQSAKQLPALRELAASEGIDLRFDELREVNTRRAHRVFQLGRAKNRGEAMLDRLFVAYFSECRDLADPEVLADLAVEVGLDRDAALAAATGEGAGEGLDEAVEADDVRGRMLGATGVPFSFFNGKYRVSGAQTAEVFAQALDVLVEREFGVARPG